DGPIELVRARVEVRERLVAERIVERILRELPHVRGQLGGNTDGAAEEKLGAGLRRERGCSVKNGRPARRAVDADEDALHDLTSPSLLYASDSVIVPPDAEPVDSRFNRESGHESKRARSWHGFYVFH